MGAMSSCCAVEESEEKQMVKDTDRSVGDTKGKSSKPRTNKEKSGRGNSKRRGRDADAENPNSYRVNDTGSSAAHTATGSTQELQNRLKLGMRVWVLLQDGTKLACTLSYNSYDRTLSISCEDKVRVIQLSDIKTLLHGRDQLKRVETKANLVDDPNCVALHLVESGNCIPVRFDELSDKNHFVNLVQSLKD